MFFKIYRSKLYMLEQGAYSKLIALFFSINLKKWLFITLNYIRCLKNTIDGKSMYINHNNCDKCLAIIITICVLTYNSQSCIILYLKLADITKFHFVSKEINRIIIIMNL